MVAYVIRRDDRGYYTYETVTGTKQFRGCTEYKSRAVAQNVANIIATDGAAFTAETVDYYDDLTNTVKTGAL